METQERGWVVTDSGKIQAIASDEESARDWAFHHLMNEGDRTRKYRWTDTRKLMTPGRPSGTWRFTGIEITPAPIV
jgi:hypothetical protein